MREWDAYTYSTPRTQTVNWNLRTRRGTAHQFLGTGQGCGRTNPARRQQTNPRAEQHEHPRPQASKQAPQANQNERPGPRTPTTRPTRSTTGDGKQASGAGEQAEKPARGNQPTADRQHRRGVCAPSCPGVFVLPRPWVFVLQGLVAFNVSATLDHGCGARHLGP